MKGQLQANWRFYWQKSLLFIMYPVHLTLCRLLWKKIAIALVQTVSMIWRVSQQVAHISSHVEPIKTHVTLARDLV